MIGEKDFHAENTEKTKRSSSDICVLLLDSDDTCPVNLSEKIYKCGYRVLTTTRADDLLHIINRKDEKIDIVLAEFDLIEMNKYELLEKIRSICEIPVVVVGAEVNCAVISECLCRGVEFYLKKPLKKGLLENLWQFTARRQGDFHSKIDTNPPEKKYSITHTQSPVDFFNRTKKNNAVKIEDPGEYEGENFESEYKKEPELIYSEMQNELRQTDELSHGDKRKERGVTDAGSDLGDQKKPKLIPADDLQCRSLEAVPDVEEATNGRKEPFKSVFEIEEKLELACKEKELLAEWSTHPVTNFAAYVGYEFEEREFQPLESVGECMGHHETPLSPQESSNKDVIGKQQMKKTDIALDEELMQDGISLWDLEFDMQEVQSYAPDLEKKANQELFNEIFTDLANELKP